MTTTTKPTLTTKSNESAIKWTRHHDHDCAGRVYTAIVEIAMRRSSGAPRLATVALRVDGREGSYRVDLKEMADMPWEAADGGTGFRTVAEARAYAKLWRAACAKQNTLCPSDVARFVAPRPAFQWESEAVDYGAAA